MRNRFKFRSESSLRVRQVLQGQSANLAESSYVIALDRCMRKKSAWPKNYSHHKNIFKLLISPTIRLILHSVVHVLKPQIFLQVCPRFHAVRASKAQGNNCRILFLLTLANKGLNRHFEFSLRPFILEKPYNTAPRASTQFSLQDPASRPHPHILNDLPPPGVRHSSPRVSPA